MFLMLLFCATITSLIFLLAWGTKCRHRVALPANTGHSPNAVPMLGQRQRRCANIETAFGECSVFAWCRHPANNGRYFHVTWCYQWLYSESTVVI